MPFDVQTMWPLMCILLAGWASAQPQVEISSGLVEGRNINTHYRDDEGRRVSVNSFYGIPFAKPPVGNLRFAVSINSVFNYPSVYVNRILNNYK